MRASYRSSYKRGWFGESHRHYLAAKGVRTGHSYFAKGNREDYRSKSLLATPKAYVREDGLTISPSEYGMLSRDEKQMYRPVYPTKAELGLAYSPKRQSRGVTQEELMEARIELQNRYGRPEETSFGLPMVPQSREMEPVQYGVPQLEGIEVQAQEVPAGQPEPEATGLPGAGAAAGFMDAQMVEEKPAYPQIYAAKKEYFMVKKLPYGRISQLAQQPGVRAVAVENFLSTVDANPTKYAAEQNLQMDARLYKWSPETVYAIQQGIDEAFQDEK